MGDWKCVVSPGHMQPLEEIDRGARFPYDGVWRGLAAHALWL